nr:MAG TPA: hypothetical protein [Caudoviricetes sp.]
MKKKNDTSAEVWRQKRTYHTHSESIDPLWVIIPEMACSRKIERSNFYE